MLHKVKDYLDDKALYLLYNSLIVSYLTCCVECDELNVTRIISRSQYRDPSNPLFVKLQLLKFSELVDLSMLQIMYKAHRNILPSNIQNWFEKRESCYDLKGFEIFKKTRFRTKLKERCVTVRGISLWNNLNKESKEAKSNFVFKKSIKASMLHKYRETCL